MVSAHRNRGDDHRLSTSTPHTTSSGICLPSRAG